MPAKSKKQQRFFGLIKSIQEGKTKGTARTRKIARNITKKAVDEYAKTKIKNLPLRKRK